MRLRTLSIAFGILSVGLAAHAAPITTVYNLRNVGLLEGSTPDGTLSGTFTITDNANVYTLVSADLVASPSTSNTGGYTYLYGTGVTPNSTLFGTPTSTYFGLSSNSGFDLLELTFASALNGSGNDAIVTGANSFEDEVLIQGVGDRTVATGSATLGAAATPEPAGLVLLGSGMLSAVCLFRRRSQAAGLAS